MFRQGDLFFVKVKKELSDGEVVKDGVIARGEVTGHTHRIRGGSQAALMLIAGVAYVHALRETAIDHEEHGTITLPSGNWEVKRQREYAPDGWRRVAD
jgi:hypothetical protein